MKAPILKSLARPACLAAALGMAILIQPHAADGTTTLLQERDPSVYVVPDDIVAGHDGLLYGVGIRAVGVGTDSEQWDTIVIRSLDRGETWEQSFSMPADPESFLNAAVDGAGNLYAMYGARGIELWRSEAADQGANLQSVTHFAEVLPADYYLVEQSLAADAAGNVFVCGRRPIKIGQKTYNRWMVAKGSPAAAGLDWSVVDEFTLDSKYGSFATALAIRPSNDPLAPSEVWVRGTVGTKSGDRVVLRRSVQSGALGTWQTMATYSGDTRWPVGMGIKSLAVGPGGEVYSAGQVQFSLSRKQTENRWTTWRLAPGSSTVDIVDQLTVSSGAYNVAVDGSGRVYVHGLRSGFDGAVVRTSASGNAGAWGDYDLAANTTFYGMTLDDEGSLYLAGELCEPDACLGCVRKLPAP